MAGNGGRGGTQTEMSQIQNSQLYSVIKLAINVKISQTEKWHIFSQKKKITEMSVHS